MAAVRLLLVDDDRLILTTLSSGLRAMGYEVEVAASAEAALVACAGSHFDLALLDIAMPGVSGIELARQMRCSEGPPVVFLSAYSDLGLVETAVGEGALGYLVKPLDITQVVPTLEAALARSREVQALLMNKDHLSVALESSRVISIAVGIFMERHRVDRQQAFENLRRHARNQRRRLEDVAEDIVTAAERLSMPLGAT